VLCHRWQRSWWSRHSQPAVGDVRGPWSNQVGSRDIGARPNADEQVDRHARVAMGKAEEGYGHCWPGTGHQFGNRGCPRVKASVILADAAQTADGKLFVLGAGWSFTGPQVGPMALAILVEVQWHEANQPHSVTIELRDTDGQLVQVGTDKEPLRIEAELEVGRPAGHPIGTPFLAPLAINIPPGLPLEPGRRFVWVVSIDGETDPNWEVGFNVRPRAAKR
jgi:hypothetical protein